jgi:phage gpG-like protein
MARVSSAKGITVEGLREVLERFDTMEEHSDNAGPALERSLDLVMLDTKRRFDTGKGWRALDAQTKARKAREGIDPRPLHGVTGDLAESLTRRGARGQVRDVGDIEGIFGTTVYYARFHEKGEGGVPKRRLVQMTRDTREHISTNILKWLMGDELPPRTTA